MAIITQNASVNLFVATLKLNHIVGVTFIIEGIIGIVNITSIKENLNKQQLIKKYIYIIFIIIGTYIYLTININNLKIAYFISVLAFILGVIMLFFMFKNLPKKKNISLNKLN